jgi:hypothetical protein
MEAAETSMIDPTLRAAIGDWKLALVTSIPKAKHSLIQY